MCEVQVIIHLNPNSRIAREANFEIQWPLVVRRIEWEEVASSWHIASEQLGAVHNSSKYITSLPSTIRNNIIACRKVIASDTNVIHAKCVTKIRLEVCKGGRSVEFKK
jgi:hypothetical protein